MCWKYFCALSEKNYVVHKSTKSLKSSKKKQLSVLIVYSNSSPKREQSLNKFWFFVWIITCLHVYSIWTVSKALYCYTARDADLLNCLIKIWMFHYYVRHACSYNINIFDSSVFMLIMKNCIYTLWKIVKLISKAENIEKIC